MLSGRILANISFLVIILLAGCSQAGEQTPPAMEPFTTLSTVVPRASAPIPEPSDTLNPSPTPTSQPTLATASPTIASTSTPIATRPPFDEIGSGMIAFVSDRDGDYEIYLMTLPGSGGEGREILQVSNNEADDMVPEWSPDGSQIAFSSDRDGNHEIYLIDVESALELREDYTPARLTHDDAEDMLPSWSPDGAQIAFSSMRDGNREIYLMDSNGGNLRRITHNAVEDNKPTWSPDGTRIAFDSGSYAERSIMIMDADGENQRFLISPEGGWPDWSPDGFRIAFFGRLDGNPDIYIVDTDGTNLRRMTENNHDDWEPSWSPDGEWLLFVSGNPTDIYIMSAADGKTYRLTSDNYSNWAPVWRP